MQKLHLILFVALFILSPALIARVEILEQQWPNTDFSRSIVNINEIQAGGPPKDGIPALDKPKFINQINADKWLHNDEPVIAISIGDDHRAYPLQILIYHEIVNDIVGKIPVSITFCPLCNASIVFDRRFQGRILDFGTTGKLRKSDMIMYDRQTESWWQQFIGRGLIGYYAGSELNQLPSAIVSYGAFKINFPSGIILSRQTGFHRPYGSNPYRGYDAIDQTPFLYSDATDPRLPPMERVLGIEMGSSTKIYPLSILKKATIIHDDIGDMPIVVFSQGQMFSALDHSEIKQSRKIPIVKAYSRLLNGEILHFRVKNQKIIDKNTNTIWNIFGRAVSGKLKGKQLKSVDNGVHFAFAWLAFKPDTVIYKEKQN